MPLGGEVGITGLGPGLLSLGGVVITMRTSAIFVERMQTHRIRTPPSSLGEEAGTKSKVPPLSWGRGAGTGSGSGSEVSPLSSSERGENDHRIRVSSYSTGRDLKERILST